MTSKGKLFSGMVSEWCHSNRVSVVHDIDDDLHTLTLNTDNAASALFLHLASTLPKSAKLELVENEVLYYE